MYRLIGLAGHRELHEALWGGLLLKRYGAGSEVMPHLFRLFRGVGNHHDGVFFVQLIDEALQNKLRRLLVLGAAFFALLVAANDQ
jgi:hypothetical protein